MSLGELARRDGMRFVLPWCMAVILMGYSCNSATNNSDDVTAAVVMGVVRSRTGEPVQGATVRVIGYREGCGDIVEATDAGIDKPVTDAVGSYSLLVQSILGPRTVCLAVTAITANKRDSVTAKGMAVALHDLLRSKVDTVQVNLAFP